MNQLNKYIAYYFHQSQKTVQEHNPKNQVVIQFFQKKEFAILSGITEALEILNNNLKTTPTIIRYLPEGSKIQSKEIALEIEGKYQDIGIYEGIIDGILSRATSLATNAFLCVESAKGKEIICMSDRSDHFSNQERDGKAFFVGGIKAFSSFAQAPNKNCKVYGSMPHALIQNFNGNNIKALDAYRASYPDEELIALVDYNNDVIKDSLEALKHFKNKLFGVRVDTSLNMEDRMFENEQEKYKGVNIEQIKRLRKALDKNEGKHVKIYVSSGFTPEKIASFEKANSKVDGYGVGEYLLKINNTFCCDATKLNGNNVAKAGRCYSKNTNLITHKWK